MKRRDFLGVVGSGVAGALTPGLWTAVRPVSGDLSSRPPDRPAACFVERWSWAMGQPVHLQLFASSADHGHSAAAAALAELRRVEQELTLFDDASALSELNRHAGRHWLRMGPDLERVLAESLRIERLTGGAFNPAIEPLMRAWGFRTPRTTEPSTSELEQARKAVCAARVMIRDNRVILPSADTRLDLGGIGVGYGLDRAVAILRRNGIHSAFLDVSGDCFALAAPPGKDGWPVSIAGPYPGNSPVASTLLRDAALATSANTMSVVQYGRAVRGHVMNPETGWPADALVQVTVEARTGIEADALSTAMLVSGRPAEGVVRYYKA